MTHRTLILVLWTTFLNRLYLVDGNGTTDLEDHMETEIELIAPNTFKNYAFKTLEARQLGFLTFSYNRSGEISTTSAGNWELFAFRYAILVVLLYFKTSNDCALSDIGMKHAYQNVCVLCIQ